MDPDTTVGIGTRQDWERLGRLLAARRGALGYIYSNGPAGFRVTRAAALGIKPVTRRTIYEIEQATRKNPASFRLPTLEKLAVMYDTTSASMLAVVRGEADELERRPPEPRPRPARARRHVSAAAAAGAKIAATRPYADQIMERLLEAGGGDPPGDVLFPGDPVDAETWDRRRSWGTPVQRVWLIAELRRGEAEGNPAAVAAG